MRLLLITYNQKSRGLYLYSFLYLELNERTGKMIERFFTFAVILFCGVGIFLNLFYIDSGHINNTIYMLNIFSVVSMYVLGFISHFSFRKMPAWVFLWRFLLIIYVFATKSYAWQYVIVYIGWDIVTYILYYFSYKYTTIFYKEVTELKNVNRGGRRK